jgi:porin
MISAACNSGGALLRYGLIILLACFSRPCAAQAAPDWNAQTLTGDWGGARMSERGLTTDILYTGDVLANTSGGTSRGTKYMDNIDIRFELDLGRFAGWHGATALLHVISDQGSGLNAHHVHSFMGVDHIEVDTNTTKLYQAWIEQRAFDDKLALLAGLYAVDSEFDVTESSDVLLHPAFGTAPVLAQSGRNGPSIFPTTSFGARIKYRPSPAAYFQMAVLDGVPGDPNHPRGTHIRFEPGDGAFLIAEAGFSPMHLETVFAPERSRRGAEPPREREQREHAPISKVALGYWEYTARLNDLTEVDSAGNPLRRRSNGAYVLAEQTLYRERQDAQQGLTTFAGYGVAERNVNRIDYSLTAGLRYEGLLPGRDEDVLALGFARAHASAKYRQVLSLESGKPATSAETAVELTYRMQLQPWFALQPVIQRIARPGFGAASATAWIAGLRTEIAF